MSDLNSKLISEMSDVVNKQREFFLSGQTLCVKWRALQLKKLKKAIIANCDELTQALVSDLGRSDTEAYLCDIGPAILEINETLHHIKKWARPEKVHSGIMAFPSSKTLVYKMPYGVSLIISPFNFPSLLSFGPLIAAIAGGNTAVIKVSSKSTASSRAIKKIISSTFPSEFVTVIEGEHDVADAILAQRFDKIFYTGSPNVAKHILTEAATNLTPCALELGGETGNWAIVRADAALRDAARKIAFFKILNSGQICINVNQVAVAKEVADEFVNLLKEEIIRQIGKEPLNNTEYPHLIGQKAYEKCESEALQYKDRIVLGGKGDPKTLRFEPTVIYPVGIDEKIVNHELFCPLLPIVTYSDKEIDTLLKTIEKREHGLALYLFTRNISWAKKAIAKLQFGGGCVNEVVMHLIVKGVPFNGTGHSGMGAYHGEWGFREFTHPKTVLYGKTHFNLTLREHPYSGKIGQKKLRLIKMLEK